MKIVSYFFLLIVLILGVTFSVLNADQISFNYYFGSRELPLSLVLVIALAFGTILGLLVSLGLVFKLKRRIAKLNKTVRVTEREVMNLRSIPVKDEH